MNSEKILEEKIGFELAILSENDREELVELHPILGRAYMLPTPMMREAYEIIRDRVWARRTGLVFFASPRTGKSKCATAVRDYLIEEFPKIYVTRVNAKRATRATDTHMYRMILAAERHSLSSRANSENLLGSLLAHIEVNSKIRGGRQFVLLIDEMQLLNGTDLQQLVSLHNDLEEIGIKMTTISFAQPEIINRRTLLLAGRDKQIIARFLSELVHFNGVSDRSNLLRILMSYDVDSEFPEGSGWSYTRFFVPQAYNNGFRLGNYLDLLWEALSKAAGIGGCGALPMEHTCSTIEFLLLTMRRQDCSTLSLSVAEIENAVTASGLQNFSMVMTDGE